jgi:predicted flap endonuclease-1-like 5' DNA nuclease
MRRTFRIILVLIVGYYLLQWWLAQQEKQEQPSTKVTPPAKPPVPVKETPQSSDVLAELDGIGPAYERALNALGIRTFSQLAEQNADELAAKLSSVRITAARIKRDQWIEQAAARASSPVSTSTRWSANDGYSA